MSAWAHELLNRHPMRPRLITPTDPHAVALLLPTIEAESRGGAPSLSIDSVVNEALEELRTGRIRRADPEVDLPPE